MNQTPDSFSRIHLLNMAIMAIAIASVLAFSWTGYLASDDMMYASAARGWLEDSSYLGKNHWSLRHPAVLPVAVSFRLFGVNEFSLVLPTTIYFLSVAGLVYWTVANILGARAAAICLLLLVSTPLLALNATIPGCDYPESFFIILSLTLAYLGKAKGNYLIMMAAGLAAGLAWMTRETAGSLLLFYGILLLVSRSRERKLLLVLSISAASVILAELFYYWLRTGDIIYKLWIDIDQGRSDPTHIRTPVHDTGNIELMPAINPLLAILVNQEFMFLYYVAIPAAIHFIRKAPSNYGYFKYLSWYMILSFLVISYLIPVRELPRYYMTTTVCAAVISGAWVYLMSLRKKGVAIAVLAGILITNLAGIYIDNKNPLFGERTLVDWLLSNPGKVVYTDPSTMAKSMFLLTSRNIEKRVHHGLPPPGGYYLYNPNRVMDPVIGEDYSMKYRPDAHWTVITTVPASERVYIHKLVDLAGLDSLLPPQIYRKLVKPNRDITIYRRPAE